MPSSELLDALPDLVLLVKRDGTPVAHAGGRSLGELGCGAEGSFAPAWSESTSLLLRQLTLVPRTCPQKLTTQPPQ